MELLDGESLRERLAREGATRPDLALAWVAQIADGLDAAHRAGVIHRDLKPENIFITRAGKLKVLDFGIAKFEGFGHAQTKASETMGTIPYMSPEHLAGQPLDARSDVYSVGLILYEMLAGRHPHAGPDGELPPLEQLLPMMLGGSPESLASFVGPEIDALVCRALALRPEERFHGMSELAEGARSLRAQISGTSSSALRLGTLSGLGTSSGSRPALTVTPADGTPGHPPEGITGRTLAILATVAALTGAGAIFGLGAPSEASDSTPLIELQPTAPTSAPSFETSEIPPSETAPSEPRASDEAPSAGDGSDAGSGAPATPSATAPSATTAPPRPPAPAVRPRPKDNGGWLDP